MVFTCVTCSVAFSEAEAQRLHFKTEWHRYNLKRKVAQLPTINANDFQERIVQHQQASGVSLEKSKVNKKDEGDAHHNCSYCHKVFASQNAFDNHLRAKRHLEAVKNHGNQRDKKSIGDHATKYGLLTKKRTEANFLVENIDNDDDWSDISDEENASETPEGEALFLEECIFCSHLSGNLEDNVLHMVDVHSFFIPDTEYLTDLEGLVRYLDEKVGVGHVCLWCKERGKAFHSARAAQQHMRDKGHCRMLFEESNLLEEFCDFYDYSLSYPEDADSCSVSRDKDEEVKIETLDDGGFELELPSGAVIGHRSLMRYYKQSLPPERPHRKNIRALSAVVAHYRGLGWIGMTRSDALQKYRAIDSMNTRCSKHYMQLGVKNNKLQKHFREQVLF